MASAHCHGGLTQVLVEVDTDVSEARPFTLHAAVQVENDSLGAAHEWVRGPDGGGLVLPASFGILPPAQRASDGPLTLVITATLAGSDATPAVSIRRTARFRFTPRLVTRLPIFLSVSCAAEASGCRDGVVCTVSEFCDERGLTCGDDGECVPIDVQTESPESDEDGGSPQDASRDARRQRDARSDRDARRGGDLDGGATDESL
jgi:hypothetical protein